MNDTTTTDYDFPVWFWDEDTTDKDRSQWMSQERARRQAMRQKTGYKRQMEREHNRMNRRQEASPAFVKLEEYQ
jgi:hypothetical protein